PAFGAGARDSPSGTSAVPGPASATSVSARSWTIAMTGEGGESNSSIAASSTPSTNPRPSQTTSTGAEATARFGRWIQIRLGEESRVTMRSATSSEPISGPEVQGSRPPSMRGGASGGAQTGGGASGAATARVAM